MSTILRHISVPIIGLCCLLGFSACDGGAVPEAENGCIWVADSIPAQFLYAEFYPPQSNCEPCFENQCWDNELSIEGVYELLYNIENGLYSHDFVATWITSIDTKKCDNLNLNDNNQKIRFTSNDYTQYINSYDIISNSPLVQYSCGFSFDEYKHQLIIQIPDAYNECTDSYGTITWTYLWLGEENAPVTDPNWQFEFPVNGLRASYAPNIGNDRSVYLYDEFENVP